MIFSSGRKRSTFNSLQLSSSIEYRFVAYAYCIVGIQFIRTKRGSTWSIYCRWLLLVDVKFVPELTETLRHIFVFLLSLVFALVSHVPMCAMIRNRIRINLIRMSFFLLSFGCCHFVSQRVSIFFIVLVPLAHPFKVEDRCRNRNMESCFIIIDKRLFWELCRCLSLAQTIQRTHRRTKKKHSKEFNFYEQRLTTERSSFHGD